MITRYGWEWPEEASDLTIELAAFKMGLGPECRGLGKAEHFWRVVDTQHFGVGRLLRATPGRGVCLLGEVRDLRHVGTGGIPG